MRKRLLIIGIIFLAIAAWASTGLTVNWVGGIIIINTPADIKKPRVAIDGDHANGGLLLRNSWHLISLSGKSAFLVIVSDDAFETILKPYFTSAAAIANGDKGYKGRGCWKAFYDDYPNVAKRVLLYPVTQGEETVMMTVKAAQDLGVPIVKSLVRVPVKFNGSDVTGTVE
jgi:hypothetical protein